MGSRLKVLLSAYACEPGQGSEPGVGWNWAKQIARFHEVWVLTRANNRQPIEQALAREPMPNVHWIYYDLPRWARFWKRGRRGVHLYYSLWQIQAYMLGKRLHAEVGFDFVHHVTLGNYWLPSFLSLLPIPFVWGPLAGGESAPQTFYQTFGIRGKVYELSRTMAQKLGSLNPLVRLNAQRAIVTLAATEETRRALLALSSDSNVVVCSQQGISLSEIPGYAYLGDPHCRFASVGRLLHWKGFHLGLIAFARFHKEFPQSEYWLFGEGPEQQNLERLVRKLGVTGHVRFWGNLPRTRVLEKLAECDVLVHPSLHDSTPAACLEAMATGCSVLCLDLGGPALQVTDEIGFKVPAHTPEQVVSDLTTVMLCLAQNPDLRQRMGKAARQKAAEYFDWEKKGDRIREIYQEVMS